MVLAWSQSAGVEVVYPGYKKGEIRSLVTRASCPLWDVRTLL